MDLRTRQEIQAECRDLVIAYACANDSGDGEALAQVFAPDGIWDRQGLIHRNRDEIRQTLRNRPTAPIMRNIITNILVTVIDETHAESRCYYTAYRHEGEGGLDLPRPLTGPAIIGEYTNRFVLTQEGWRIAYHSASRVFVKAKA